ADRTRGRERDLRTPRDPPAPAAAPARVRRGGVVTRAVALAVIVGAFAIDGQAAPGPADAEAVRRAFLEVARVLPSPRCQTRHPAGARPMQTDPGRPHKMNVSRRSLTSGLACGTCHQERNSEALGIAGGPPGAPRWGLPPVGTPMVFEGRTPRALCEQLND